MFAGREHLSGSASSTRTPTRSSRTIATAATSRARVGQPELKVVSDSKDKKTRLVDLRIPVTEGTATRSAIHFDGNTVVKSEVLRPMFKVEPGEFYSEKSIRKGLEKAREVYGAGGYFEFTGYPDYKFRDEPNPPSRRRPTR